MIQRLPEILVQVKGSKTSENLLNEISKIIYSLYRTKEITKKICGNTQPENIGPQDVPSKSPYNDSRMSPKYLIWQSWVVPIWRPGDALKWRPWEVVFWRSRDVPGRLIQDVPYRFKFKFSFRTYSIDQIYLKALQRSRCTENTVKLLRWSVFCGIN